MPGRKLHLSDRVVDLGTGEVPGRGRLRPAELALLSFLADRIGEWVGPDELHARVWGYAPTVRSRTAYSTAGRLRNALEADPRDPRHLMSRRGGGYALVNARVEVGPAEDRWTNVAEPEPLVGRDGALESILAGPAPLWTLTGPGGVGKSRLARSVSWASRPAGGAWWCDLQLSTTAAEVEAEVGRVLPELGPIPIDQRLAALGDVMVGLDHLETAGREGTDLVQRWLVVAPRARFVVTGRQPLGLAAERVLRLGPLARPDAVTLLRRWAARRDAGARVSDPVADELCARVDDLPLGIEIVAANLALFGAEAMLDRLRRGDDVASREIDRPERHRSLDELLAGSWRALDPAHRRCLAALARIEGAFGLAAAELASADPDAVDVLADLVDASLVVPADPGFALLTTVRNAVRRFEPVDDDLILDRLLEPRLDGVPMDEPWTPPPHSAPSLSTAAFARLVERTLTRKDLDRDRVGRIVLLLVDQASDTGADAALLVRWIDRALDRGPSDRVRAWLLYRRITLRRVQGDRDAARAYDEVGRLARETGLLELAWAADHNRWHLPEVRHWELADRVAAEGQAIGLPRAHVAEGTAAFLRMVASYEAGDLVGAERWCRASVEAFDAAGRSDASAAVEPNLPRFLLDQGRIDDAADVLAEIERAGREPDLQMTCRILALRGRLDELAVRCLAVDRIDHTFQSPRRQEQRVYLGGLLLEVGLDELGCRLLRDALTWPSVAPETDCHRPWCRGMLLLVEGRAAEAEEQLLEAIAVAEAADPGQRDGLTWGLAQARWALGDGRGAVQALVDAIAWTVPLEAADPAHLLAESFLRIGETDRARDVAVRMLQLRIPPAWRARAHGVLAVCGAVDGDAAEVARHRPEVDRGSGGWNAIHRGWLARLVDGHEPEPVEGPFPTVDRALAHAAGEMRRTLPAWADRPR